MDEGRVFLVEQDLDPLNVAVDAKEDEEMVALGQVLVQVGHEEDTSGIDNGLKNN